jgi:uncharacterized protein (DUF1800 family)
MDRTALQPLEKLDPAREWAAWKPSKQDPWNLRWAGHLYRRAGFGNNLAGLRQAVADGFEKTLQRLCEGEPGADERLQSLTRTGQLVARRDNPEELRGWWLYCMLHGLHPLREKMTLFWHDHFATSVAKVNRTVLMFRQNLTLREHALGRFPPLLLAMSKDPAMLLWLDSASNVKGKPNENFAREIMELFSLGVGNYTEKDIREAARAFTGWQVEDDQFHFNRRQHDDGEKTVLGTTGKLTGEDVVKILVKQPSCARFLVRKLYTFLVSDIDTPPASFLEPLAEDFRQSDYDIKALVRRILSSRHFYSAHAYRRKVKSPIDYTVGLVWATTDRRVPQGGLTRPLAAMGMELFAPPNVKGWPGGKAWLNTSTVLARHNFAFVLVTSGLKDDPRSRRKLGNLEAEIERQEELRREAEEAARRAEEERLRQQGKPIPPRPAQPRVPPPPENMDVVKLIEAEKAATPEAALQVLVDLFLQGDLPAATRDKLLSFLKKGDLKGDAYARRLRETAHVLLTLPEYQLA